MEWKWLTSWYFYWLIFACFVSLKIIQNESVSRRQYQWHLNIIFTIPNKLDRTLLQPSQWNLYCCFLFLAQNYILRYSSCWIYFQKEVSLIQIEAITLLARVWLKIYVLWNLYFNKMRLDHFKSNNIFNHLGFNLHNFDYKSSTVASENVRIFIKTSPKKAKKISIAVPIFGYLFNYFK